MIAVPGSSAQFFYRFTKNIDFEIWMTALTPKISSLSHKLESFSHDYGRNAKLKGS